MPNRAQVVKVGITGIACVALAPLAFADIGWSIDAGAGHTDNATLVDANPVSDTLSSIGGAIFYSLDSRRIQASLDGRGSYIHYADETYEDDFQGLAAGSLMLGIVPDTFLWAVEDTYGQITINQFEPVTPENRQNINNFSTGPDLILRLGGQSDLTFSGRYGDVMYEESDQIDEQTLKASLAFRRKLSENASWGIVATDTRVEYDAPGNPEYDRPAVYATWSAKGDRQSLSADLGANRIETDTESFTKPLVRLKWNRRVAPSWTMDLNLASEYQNTSEQFISRNLQPDLGTADVLASANPAAAYYGSLLFAFERPRTRLSLGGGYSQLDYVNDVGVNENSWYGTGEFSRQMTPRLQGFVTYRYEQNEYETVAAQDRTRQIAGVRVDWRVGKATFVTGGYTYTDSDSDSLLNTYTGNLYYLTLSYRYGTIASTPFTF